MFGLVVNAIQNVNPDPNPNPNPSPNPQPSPGPQPSPVNPDGPVAPIEDIAGNPLSVAMYVNNNANSSMLVMPNIANVDEMYDMVSTISNTPMGGTAMLAITSHRLDASVVAALLLRRDINVNIACFVNGRLSLIVIPANADLAGVIEADGSIKIARLADTFGATGM